jgi:hypothetical protein
VIFAWYGYLEFPNVPLRSSISASALQVELGGEFFIRVGVFFVFHQW